MIDWRELLTALSLVLVLEGILPFANPAGMRRMMAAAAQMSDRQMRISGALAMIVGLVMLGLVRS